MTASTIKSPSLKKGMLQLGFISLLNLIFPVLLLAYVSRQLGPATLGAFYLYNGLLGWFLLLADFGVGLHASRELAARTQDSAAFASAFRSFKKLQIIASLFAFFCFETIVALTPFFRAHRDVGLILGFCLLAVPLTNDWLYQSQGRFQNLVFRSIATKALTLAAIMFCVQGPSDLIAYAVILSGSAFFYALPTWPESLRIWNSGKGLASMLPWKPAALLLASALTVSLYIHLDSVWLGLLAPTQAVGIYNAGLRVAKLAALVLTSGSMAVVVRLAGSASTESEGILQKTLAYVFVVMIPVSGLLALHAPDIISLLYGQPFADAVPILRISSLQLIFIGLSNYMGMQVLLHHRNQGWIFLATASAAVVGLSLTWLLVPDLGAEGAAAGSLSAEIVVALIEMMVVARLYPQIPFWPAKPGILMLGYAIGGGLAYAVQTLTADIPLILRIVLVSGAGLIGMGLVFGWGKEPLTLAAMDLARKKWQGRD